MPLIEVIRHKVKVWAAELVDSGLSPSSVVRCVHPLFPLLTAPVDAEILTSNPAARIGIKVGDTSKERYLTHKESRKLLGQYGAGSVDEALVALLLSTGLRWGEAVGLQITRVDLKRGIIRVDEVWDIVDKMLRLYPKSRRRTVPLPGWVAKKIKPLMKGRADGYVLRSSEGDVVDYSNWRRRVWLPALTASGIASLTIHDLRHTYASWLILDGVPLEEVGRLLGHVSPLTTRRYAHLAETPTELVLAALPDPTQKTQKRGATVGQSPTGRPRTRLYRAVDNRDGKTA